MGSSASLISSPTAQTRHSALSRTLPQHAGRPSLALNLVLILCSCRPPLTCDATTTTAPYSIATGAATLQPCRRAAAQPRPAPPPAPPRLNYAAAPLSAAPPWSSIDRPTRCTNPPNPTPLVSPTMVICSLRQWSQPSSIGFPTSALPWRDRTRSRGQLCVHVLRACVCVRARVRVCESERERGQKVKRIEGQATGQRRRAAVGAHESPSNQASSIASFSHAKSRDRSPV